MTRKEVAGIVAVAFAVMSPAWNVGAVAARMSPGQTVLRTTTLPHYPPEFVKRRLGGPPYELDVDGFDGNSLLVGVSNNVKSVLVRFDPRSGTWIRGIITNVPSTAVLPVGDSIWMILIHTESNGNLVARGVFTGESSAMKVVYNKRNWEASVMAVDGQGRGHASGYEITATVSAAHVWLAGSGGPDTCGGRRNDDSVCGYSVVERVKGMRGLTRPVRVTRSGTETDMEVGPGGALWLLVPHFRRLPGRHQDQAALVRYDPANQKITQYVVPEAVWPGGYTWGPGAQLYIRSNGTIWIVYDAYPGPWRAIRFRNGSFTSHILRMSRREIVHASPDHFPVMAWDGTLWFCGVERSTPIAANPNTGAVTFFPNRSGAALLRDQSGTMWYVREWRRGAPGVFGNCGV